MIDQSGIDILVVAASMGVSLKRTSAYRGGQWSGACPVCGGTDRFNVYPVEGKWFCRQCAAGGDPLGLIAHYHGLTLSNGTEFKRALELLGLSPDVAQRTMVRPPSQPPQQDTKPPAPTWQANARRVVEMGMETLWGNGGGMARDYLYSRGLNDDIIRRAQLGYFPGMPDEWVNPIADWTVIDDDMKAHKVAVPCGITIPHFAGGHLWNIRVRRSKVLTDETGRKLNSKYMGVKGGKRTLYWADHVQPGKPVLIDEGELNVLSIAMSTDAVSPVGIVSASNYRIEQQWWGLLASAPRIYVRMDEGAAGERAAEFLANLSGRARLVHVPIGKDPNDLLKADGTSGIRRWLQCVDDMFTGGDL